MITVVLDTNVVVSAALNPAGAEARVLEMVARHEAALSVSHEVLGEYEDVLARPKFSAIDPQRIARLLALIANRARVVVASARVSASPDEMDNRFLECAEAAQAQYLVTGNKRHFPKRWKSTKVVNARELLETLRDL